MPARDRTRHAKIVLIPSPHADLLFGLLIDKAGGLRPLILLTNGQHSLLTALDQTQQIDKRFRHGAELRFITQIDQERSCGEDVFDFGFVVGDLLLFSDHHSKMGTELRDQLARFEGGAEDGQLLA